MNCPKKEVVSKGDSSQLHFLLRLIQTHFGPNFQKLIWTLDIKILPEIVVGLTGWLAGTHLLRSGHRMFRATMT